MLWLLAEACARSQGLLHTRLTPARWLRTTLILIFAAGLPAVVASISTVPSLELSSPIVGTVVSEQPFDPTYWVRKAEQFADDKSKVALLAMELLHTELAAAKRDAELAAELAAAKKDAELAAAKKDAELAAAKKDAELAAAKKDAELAAAKKDAELAAAKKDAELAAELAAAKMVAEKYKELLLKEEETTIRLEQQCAKSEESDLRHRAAMVATLANRNVIEIGLKAYGHAPDFTKRHAHFLSNILVDSNGKLRPGPQQTLRDLKNVSSSTADNRDVQKELNQFEHELAKPLHNLQTAGMTRLEGVLIGGDEPLCSALAVYVAELQKLNHISLLVTLINKNYDRICCIDGGSIRLPR